MSETDKPNDPDFKLPDPAVFRPHHVRYRRALAAHRDRLVENACRKRNTTPIVEHRHRVHGNDGAVDDQSRPPDAGAIWPLARLHVAVAEYGAAHDGDRPPSR